ncbi:hypothetical protein MXD62_26250 [Frankia sp. Mgl5]|uniref:DUF4286 family protein n=1 Tax=Frankia sp. Mgl5 TaxID=2933793 RepID=UPI00200FAA27|nr:DUF4286 family protein [Frankia sp. Mgl5]MCK9930624.1 hypothetical protein [Frankia sp. Mgl5]
MDDHTLYLVFSNPVEGKEREFNAWYDTVHVPEVLATPGMLWAQRYVVREAEINRAVGGATPAHRYLLVYEMEGDVDAIMAKVREAVASGGIVMSDTLDLGNVSMSFWTALGPKVRPE